MGVLDSFRLDGRTAIVTGGNRGIGRAIAKGLADVGANVVIANRNEDAGAEAAADITADADVETLAVRIDITSEADVWAMVEEVVDTFGGIDVLVNNAGITYHNSVADKSVAEFQETIDINLTGAYRCSKYAGEVMKGDGGGR